MGGNIIGNQNPVVGIIYTYEFNLLSLLGSLGSDFEWHIFKKQKTGRWKDITNTPKKGSKVTYQFGEIALGIEFEMKVYEIKQGLLSEMGLSKNLIGTFSVVPIRNKVSKINKVTLFNRGAKNINKANYRDTLVAEAHCIAMFNEEIEFQLWEDDAKGEGHNTEINKNNRSPKIYKARVNEKGIAEVRIPLMSDEKVLRQIANKYMMRGDQNEGANHEYYVTASHAGKIQVASPTNVDIANPDYKKERPNPQPQKDTPKFPENPRHNKQPDPKGNIIEAVFINNEGKELSKITLGGPLRVRIHSKNMVGKHIQYVIWEKDATSHDEIYRSKMIKIPADVCDTYAIILSKDLFKKGIDLPISDPDADKQNYFIEIISKDLSAESVKFGVDTENGILEVEQVRSPVIIKETKEEGKVCECEARVRAFMRMLRVGEGTNSEKGYTTQFSRKQFSDMSDHPHEIIKANGYSSSAAGAYQIMSDTYDGLKAYRKKYNIVNFNQESQDKLCLVILKYNYVDDRPNSFYNPIYWKDKNKTIRDTDKENKIKERRKKFKGQQADIIQLIIENDIKKATLLSSLCWASLPAAPYGQPTETTAECKANYEKFLKEELTNKQTWKLHLKDGFLKEFGYSCCGKIAATPSKGCGGKIDIDLRSKMIFHPQKTSTDCNLQCRKIMSSLQVTPENPTESGKQSFYQTAIESKDHTNLILNTNDFKNGINYIDKSLEAGYPIMVGVNHTLNYGYNESINTTDHYVIIVGRFCDNGTLKYRFWDVATRRGAEGDFKFTLTTEKMYSDNVWKSGRIYTLTQIRRNIDSKGNLIIF